MASWFSSMIRHKVQSPSKPAHTALEERFVGLTN